MMDTAAKPYHGDLKRERSRSYLLRLWRSDESGGFNWQASLEIPGTGERIGFAGLEELFAYLMDQTTKGEQK